MADKLSARGWHEKNCVKYWDFDPLSDGIVRNIHRLEEDYAKYFAAELEAENKRLRENPVQFMVQGGPVVMSKDFDAMKARAETAEARLTAALEKFNPQLAPFIVTLRGGMKNLAVAHSVDEPVGTISAQGTHLGLCEPFVIGQQSCAAPRSISEPLPTVATAGAISVVEPFIVQSDQQGGGAERVKSLDDPLGTIVTKANMCLAEPYLTKYFGTAMANSVDEPLDTITTKDRFGLVQPEWNGYRLDIRFRMLQPHELAAAQGFPADYKFQGNKSEIVKQIGNAVPCGLAKALIGSLLEGYRSKAKPELVRKAVSA